MRNGRTTTMTKSSQHQASVKYFLKPYAIILIIISKMKMIVNARSAMCRASLRVGRELM